MKFKYYLNNDSIVGIDGLDYSQLLQQINRFDDLLRFIILKEETIFKDENLYYIQTSTDECFAEWLYNLYEDCTGLRDLKIILNAQLQRIVTIDDYNENHTIICRQTEKDPDYSCNLAFLCFIRIDKSIWDVFDINSWVYLHSIYLNNIDNIREFAIGIEDCFINICFHTEIENTLKSLNTDFDVIRSEIIMHCRILNDMYLWFLEARQSKIGFQQIADDFSQFTGLRCSPQAGRDQIQRTKGEFKNTNNATKVEMNCELHTKFSTHGGNPEKQDRLYFHPGKDDIENGKILVLHIGTHL